MEPSQILTMLGTLFLMVLVFVGAYFASKMLGRGLQGPRGTGGKAEVLERLVLGKDHMLLIVRVAEKIYLLGVTPQRIEKLDELDPALFPEGEDGEPPKTDFKSLFKSNLQSFLGKGGGRGGDDHP